VSGRRSAGPGGRARPSRPRGYGWVVALVGLLVLIYISVNTLRTTGPGSSGPAPGRQLPPFAAPLVGSDLVGDANVATRRGQGAAGARPACDVTDPRALNVCALARRSPVVLAFFVTDSHRCIAQLDTLQTLVSRFPQIGFAALAIRGDRGALRKLARTHRWSFPVAQDRDGAVANLYGVAICPTVVLAYRGGRVMETDLAGEVATPALLTRRLHALLAGPPHHATAAGTGADGARAGRA
jgi:hypothetical protein